MYHVPAAKTLARDGRRTRATHTKYKREVAVKHERRSIQKSPRMNQSRQESADDANARQAPRAKEKRSAAPISIQYACAQALHGDRERMN